MWCQNCRFWCGGNSMINYIDKSLLIVQIWWVCVAAGVLTNRYDLVYPSITILYDSTAWTRSCRYKTSRSSWYDPDSPSGNMKGFESWSLSAVQALSLSSRLALRISCVIPGNVKLNSSVLFATSELISVFQMSFTNSDLFWELFWLYRQLAFLCF